MELRGGRAQKVDTVLMMNGVDGRGGRTCRCIGDLHARREKESPETTVIFDGTLEWFESP